MPDTKYCYKNSDVLINKLNIRNKKDLFEAETELTTIRLKELEENPLKGKFDFNHLLAIHRYIFQDIYKWAGKVRTVEIGKGNLFCTTPCIYDYANSIFDKYFPQCFSKKDKFDEFVQVFASNYGDLNALHPFREGNGRAQREFARIVCLECGYDFSLAYATHQEMLSASKLSFDKGDNSEFIRIFSKAITPHTEDGVKNNQLNILTMDDLTIGFPSGYDYYEYNKYENADIYNNIYKTKIIKMNAEKEILILKEKLKK